MKKTGLILIGLMILISLTACGTNGFNQPPITAETDGIWNHFFVYPMSWILIYFAELLNGSFGFSIVFVTILIRFLLLPLMLKQQRSSMAMQAMRPKMEALQEKYKDVTDPEKQKEMQQEFLEFYKENGGRFAAGCLPSLIQMPILMAFYFAIMRTEEIAASPFLWLYLGQPDPFYILPIIAGVTTLLQMRLTASRQPNDPMKTAMYIMPVFIVIVGISLPSALSLYWSVANIFVMIQTYFMVAKLKEQQA